MTALTAITPAAAAAANWADFSAGRTTADGPLARVSPSTRFDAGTNKQRHSYGALS